MKALKLFLVCLLSVGYGRRRQISDGEVAVDSSASALKTTALAMLRALDSAAAFHSVAPRAHFHQRVAGTTMQIPGLKESLEGNPIFVDEQAKLAEADFKIAPEELVLLAKRFLASRGGFGADPDLLSEDFEFAGPVVGPLSKDAFVAAISSVDIAGAFPDFNPEFHGFRVDPFEGNRVWYIARGRGTNTGPLLPFAKEPTGKTLANPPQACSLTFNEEGLVTKYTIGYVMDRSVGNTGGLGGLYGIFYALGKPLPFPEAQPWKKSKRYALFQWFGAMMSRNAKNKDS